MTKAIATKNSSTLMAKHKERIAADLAKQKAMESSVQTSNHFQVSGSILKFNDQEVENNEVCVAILGATFENTFYDQPYDKENPAPPLCWAIGEDEKKMAPHPLVVEAGNAQHETCHGCQFNVFGSAETGRGKACGNKRHIATVATGTLVKGRFKPFTKTEEVANSEVILFRLPVTSGKAFSAHAKSIMGALGVPTYMVTSRLKVVADKDNQYRVLFETEGELSDAQLEGVLTKIDEAVDALQTPFPLPEAAPAPTAKSKATAATGRGKPAAKKTTTVVKGGKPTAVKGKSRY